MKDPFNEVLFAKVDWLVTKENAHVFQAQVHDQLVFLRLNDFPDEPICTVIINDLKIDLDEFPSHWTLPLGRTKESGPAN